MIARMRIGLTVALTALSLLTCGASFAGKPARPALVELVYEPVMKADGQHFERMRVSLRFAGDRDGETMVDLPNEWGGFNKLYENLDNIQADGATIEPSDKPDKLRLLHKAGATITLSYDIVGLDQPEKLTGDQTVNEYRPIVTDNYFHLIGETVVARPEHISGDAPARFTIKPMPKGAHFASDLEHSHNGLLEFDALVESIAVGGDFRILRAGDGKRLAIRGKFDSRDDAGWVDAFKRVSSAVSAYWTTESGPYLVTVLPFQPKGPGSTSIGGTGRRDAFAFFATTNGRVDTIDQIMTHEMTHSWMPRRVGGIASDEGKQKEQYWLSEGFTDFATWRALVRQGLWTPERYFQEFNQTLTEFDASPVRALPNVEASKLFWESRDGQRLAYIRGALFAHLLDDKLQRLTPKSSLRTMLLAMQRDALKSNGDGQAVAFLRKELKKTGVPADAFISRFIDQGVPIEFPESFLSACGQLRANEQPKFHRGFDITATQANGNIITGVIENSPAWRAGLRNGMKLVERSGGELGNSMIEIAYTVEDNGVARTLRWMPQSGELENKRVFAVTALDNPETRKACIATLSR